MDHTRYSLVLDFYMGGTLHRQGERHRMTIRANPTDTLREIQHWMKFRFGPSPFNAPMHMTKMDIDVDDFLPVDLQK